MNPARPIAPVAKDPEIAPFHAAAREGRLVLPRCGRCGRLHWYPRGICPHCLSTEIEWQASPGLGRIYAATVVRQGGGEAVIAYVELDEGLRLLTNILCDEPSRATIDGRVEVAFVPSAEAPEQVHPFFRLMDESASGPVDEGRSEPGGDDLGAAEPPP